MVTCKKCKKTCEPIIKGGNTIFHFCRACKIPHDSSGSAIITSHELKSFFNPLEAARGIISQTHPNSSSVAKTAFEVMLIQSLWEAYFAGMKDGVLLAYSQDFKPDEPV